MEHIVRSSTTIERLARLPRGPDACNVMLSASGRRVALMDALSDSITGLGLKGGIVATDVTRASAAMQLATESVLVPPYRDPGCLEFLLDLCQEFSIRLIVPTIDPELAFYARHQDAFRKLGCRINISSVETIEISNDKRRTHSWLSSKGFPTVAEWVLDDLLSSGERLQFPLLVKPRFGSSSRGISIAENLAQLECRAVEQNLIVQSIASGYEFTTDVFLTREGRCRCAVPRQRLETRDGEVSKGITARNSDVASLASKIAEALPGGSGVMNIQMFHDPIKKSLAVIEINARFGGGYPLSHHAGATMTKWLLEECLDRPCTANDDDWRDGIVMLRYDSAAFVPRTAAGLRLDPGGQSW